MTKAEFLRLYAEGCAHVEGLYMTEAQAKRDNKKRWPTRAQRNSNPVNLRKWGSYPVTEDYADFPGPKKPEEWRNPVEAAKKCVDGWRAAVRQCERNIFERGLTFFTFFAGQRKPDGTVIQGGYPGFAPKKDGNNPLKYAQDVVVFMKKTIPGDYDVSTVVETVYESVQDKPKDEECE